ncbi:hypothetical protein LCGC14_0493330 [marine sediment metagenome]|uniref:Uncharacterized protein n=1 Tax=marine sediment metagenome TaxID=412755 RepID=A0A0F9VEU5_9ZZZZ
MVRVNFRKNYEIENEKIIKFFKDIGYEHIGSNNQTIKVEDEIIPTEVFVRNTQNGRYHLHVAFGFKYSGTERYPQTRVFAHFDIKKIVRGKERHFADRNEKRNICEIERIGKRMKEADLGFLEEKDQKCAHGTLDLANKEKLFEYINKNGYKKYEKGKFRKKMNGSQCTLALFKQEKFIHVVCVYARYIGTFHNLIKPKAIAELHKITKYLRATCIPN